MKSPFLYLSIPTLAVTALLTLATSSPATIVADFNFDSETIGSTPATTAPGTDPLPQDTIYAIGGFAVPTVTGTVTVQDVGGMSKAAVMTTTQAGIGALYMDTQMLVSSAFSTISFDLSVVDVPFSPLLPQATGGAPNGQAFVVQVFNLSSDRLFRFVVAPTSETEGIFGFRRPDGSLETIGTYTEGHLANHFDFVADHAAGLVDVYMDGELKLSNQPALSPTTGISEIFIFQNGVEGLTNTVAIDNIVLNTESIVPVPEPTTALFGVALLGACATRMRRRAREAQAIA